MAEECPYSCKTLRDVEELGKDNRSWSEFKGVVRASLRTIEEGIKEIKANSKTDNTDVWSAINKIRDDIKSLYWKVGLISGGSALIVSLIMHLFQKGN